MRINPFLYGALVLGVFLGVILAFRSAGVWSVSGKVNSQGERIAPSAEDVETIKGWMTLGEIAGAYNLPVAEIIVHFQLPADISPDTAVKDLESETFSVSGLRDWLQTRLVGEAAPQPVTSPQLAPPQSVTPSSQPVAPAASAEEHTPAERRVNARTTIQNLLDWGLQPETIRQIIGGELPDPGTVVKDYVTARGQEFSGAKAALQVEVDRLTP